MKKLIILLFLLLSSLCYGDAYYIATVFDACEIWDVQYAQADNTMYLVDGNDWPQKLTRAAHNDWTIADMDISTGPFLPENDEDITITPSGTKDSITLTASSSIFLETHNGSIWEINQKRSNTSYTGSLNDDESGDSTDYFVGGYSFITDGTWDATVTLERSTNNGVTWKNALVPMNSTHFDNPAETEEDGAIYRVTMSDYVSGTCDWTFTITDPLNHGVVKITDYESGTVVTGTVLTALDSTDATKHWREPYWSDRYGWPKTVCYHQQRLVFGGSTTYPQILWFSKTGNPENFMEGALDDSAFLVALTGQNPIRWLASKDYLIIGTSGSVGIWGERGEAVKFTSPAYQEQTNVGSAAIMPALASESLLYVERGNRNIREFSYSLQHDKYLSPDLTLLSEDITNSGIKDVAFQYRPQPILWCVLNNGDIATLTYDAQQQVIGWAKQTTDGDFESVCRIPGIEFEDEIWVIVNRTIDGNDYKYVERFAPRDWGTDTNDCWFVDSGLSYTGSEVNDFNGLDHLIGENIYILGDGVFEPNEVVDANGEIIIDRAAARVTAGLPYTSKYESLPLVIDPQDKAMQKHVQALDFDFYKTGYCKYGDSATLDDLTYINFENDMNFDPNATAQDLTTCLSRFRRYPYPYASKKKQTIYVESDAPFPLTIRQIITQYGMNAP